MKLVQTSANAASTRIAGEAEICHRRCTHFASEFLNGAASIGDKMPSSVADAERVVGTACVPCVDGNMAQTPHPPFAAKTTEWKLAHKDRECASYGGTGSVTPSNSSLRSKTGLDSLRRCP